MQSSFIKWTSLALLIGAAILSFIDRQILSLLVDPIKQDLEISDTQIGLLQGLAFALFYGLAAIPFGWLADRKSRKWIITGGVLFWSLMTAVSGLARSFGQLFAMRLGVGLGEATLGPSVHSMISDLFDRKHLPLAMSLYGTGISIGAGLAYLVGGQVVEVVSSTPSFQLPLVGEVRPWNAAFFIVGVPGVVLAALIAIFVPEPVRKQVGTQSAEDSATLLVFVNERRALTLGIIGGLTFLTAASFATLGWSAAFYARTFGWSAAEAGTAIGLTLIIAGISGGLMAGWLSSKLIVKGRIDAPVVVMAAATVATGVAGAITFLAPSGAISVAFLVPTIFFGTCYVGLGPTVVQSIMPSSLRGRASAWQLLTTNTFGMITGPLSVALITDFVLGDPARVGISLAICVGLFNLLGAFLLWSVRRAYQHEFARSSVNAGE
ncbi:MAG: MFS transporter [Pseudomonadota bacterium]